MDVIIIWREEVPCVTTVFKTRETPLGLVGMLKYFSSLIPIPTVEKSQSEPLSPDFL